MYLLNALVLSLLLLYTLLQVSHVKSQSYEHAKSIIDTTLSSSRYHTDVRPLNDQSKPINISVRFQLVSVVGVDDVTQSFVCNGFLALFWQDEKIVWNSSDYGGAYRILPHPNKIWRPRLILLNTLDERDLFEDDASPLTIFSSGDVLWIPGGLFKTKCDLNLKKYPFDTQTCTIQMLSMGYEDYELLFIAGSSNLDFFSPNGEWKLLKTSISSYIIVVGGLPLATFVITFSIERRPTFFVLNIILPVVLLSLLNMLVFTIPAESGEKISYGITVLLALSVFLSIISSMLPRSSDIVPYVTIYLFILLVISVFTVIVAILIVFLHSREEKEDKTRKITRQYSQATRKIGLMRKIMGGFARINTQVSPPKPEENLSSSTQSIADKTYQAEKAIRNTDDKLDDATFQITDGPKECSESKVNKYKIICKYIDVVCLAVFLFLWLILTLWYFISVVT